MRVTSLMTTQQRTAEILQTEERLANAQAQVSSGQKVQRPSDAPDQIAALLQARSDMASMTRQRDGADAALTDMQTSESTLNDMSTTLRQIRTLTLQANNATVSADQRGVIADQIESAKTRLLTLANTQVNGRYLFGGTKTDSAPFTAGPPVAYNGNGTPLDLNLTSDTPFAVSVTGNAVMNQRGSTDLFQNLNQLETAVRSGDTAGMTSGLSALDGDLSNVVRLNGDMGARIQYVQLARQQADDGVTAAQARRSSLQDVDIAQAILEENTAAVGNQAALAMAGKIGQSSLLDYLR
jgi:flagellar hook-associated protein 3 FlgL